MPRLLLASCLCFLCLTSCNSEDAEIVASLEGRWLLDKALRNNMETEMLEGLYYEFGVDSTIQTNLLGKEQNGTYSLNERSIITLGVVPKLDYKITEVSDSTLQVRTELQGFRFDFLLKRAD
ncbi:hypothetical protein [Neolewinella antarctica]|uniref:Lipocalin-like domain-containing protein n=1 Tax=Neolewinella antarctica TaxID=442734 RepID=A0ABX0X7C0_9BACT|nr:hypothetical protein [Neolewinella antarctica]NJC25118.1 hypothetical protein [Neolewinella antarctica]